MPKVAIGLFRNSDEAAHAIQQLRTEGIARDGLRTMMYPPAQPGGHDRPKTLPPQDAGARREYEQEARTELKKIGVGEPEVDILAARLRDGGVLVLAQDSDENVDRAAQLMNGKGAMALEEELRPDLGSGGVSDPPLETAEVASSAGSVQTGRVRSRSDGARVFVW